MYGKINHKIKEELYMDRTTQLWDYIMGYEIATEEELKLLTYINGYSEETLNDVLYVRTGYRSIEQLEDEE